MRYQNLGFMTGCLAACAGSVLFVAAEVVRLTIQGAFQMVTPDFWFFGWMYSCMFSVLPGGLGGMAIAWWLEHQHRNGRLTRRSATQSGMLLALAGGSAAVLVGLLYLFVNHHVMPDLPLDEWISGYFFARLVFYLENFAALASRFWLEALLALLIAGAMGGWAGRWLGQQMLER